jgi:hypothetical protein
MASAGGSEWSQRESGDEAVVNGSHGGTSRPWHPSYQSHKQAFFLLFPYRADAIASKRINDASASANFGRSCLS